MSISAIVFMILALAITWGGFAVCASIAIKKRGN